MCGLTFLFAPELSKQLMLEKNQRALAKLAHRGPDEDGLINGDGWVMGHRRLSIIDIDSSHQPMVSPEGRFHLTYNGEVYNHAELRRQLGGQWEFRTSGDTEVILAGLTIYGPHFFEKMEGMWALALWDSHAHRLLLSRDRMGKKPLYYRADGSYFACASELPTLSILDISSWDEDLDSTADYLRYGYYLPGTTAYTNVKEVLPGHWLEWSPSEELHTEHYWSLPVGGFLGNKKHAHDEFRECLERAVERRLVSDVEVGAFLSGGIDSSLIVALQSHRNGVPPKTFTIGFDESSYDERYYARLVANRYGTDHHEEVLDSWDANQLQRLILEHIGQPFADPSVLPTAKVSALAARYVKVALSGDGADELFGGYQRYQARSILRWYTRLPVALRQPAERMLLQLPEPFVHHSHSILKKMHLFLDIVKRLDAETPYVAPTMYSASHMASIAPDLINKGHTPPGVPTVCESDDILRMMVSDALVYLPQDILIKVDRASMSRSLEVRAPFLDRGVVELAFGFPRSWHRRGFSGKRMLKEVFCGLLPTPIWNRRKQGFGVPVGQWFKSSLSDELEVLLEETRSLLVPSEVVHIIRKHKTGSHDYGLHLWQIYVYLMWLNNRPFGRR
jgi:asparagine synthase (glutamine-hydrolysing)